MPGPPLTVVPLEAGDVAALLARLPTQAGVAQVLGPDGQSLLIGRPAPALKVKDPSDVSAALLEVSMALLTAPLGLTDEDMTFG